MSDKMSFLIDKISQFINTYYLDPIRSDEGYNPVNTFTWAVVLGICIFGVFRLLEKLEVKITPRFIASVLPFVLAGSSLRVLEDSPAGIIHPPLSYLLITPNIYFLVFAVTVGCLWLSIRLQKAGLVKDFHLIFAGFGLVWFFANLIILLHFENSGSRLRPLIRTWSRNRTDLCLLPGCPSFQILDIYRSPEPLHPDGPSDGCFFNVHRSR